MADRASIARELGALGVARGDVLMVHASLKALGPVQGGAAAVVGALMDAVGPDGTVMGVASWDHSPYEETLNGARMDPETRRNWPAFDPATAGVHPDFGLLNRFIADAPGAWRSAHPDVSMVALGARARELVEPHRLGQALGPGSPVERFIRMGGKVLMLGAPLNTVTALHYAEAVADIPDKRRVSYEMPLRGPDGRTVWQRCEDFDSNAILDCFAVEGGPDSIEMVVRAYAALNRHHEGMVGKARCYLFDARDLVSFGVNWLQEQFGHG